MEFSNTLFVLANELDFCTSGIIIIAGKMKPSRVIGRERA